MTPEKLALLQRSWDRFVAGGNNPGIRFYERMFAAYPSVRPLFREDIQGQAVKLMNMLNIVVNGIHDISELEESLLALGVRHRRLGVADEDYAIVRECLLATLEEGLGEAFTGEIRAAWVEAYEIIASIMIRGASAAEE